jgi:hypothetical protein
VTLNSVTTAGTQTATVQNGSPPDVDETEVRAGYKGYTQGILIDTEQAVTLGPTTNFVTSLACYTVTMPYYTPRGGGRPPPHRPPGGGLPLLGAR